MIQYGKHYIDQSDIDAVVDVLKNEFLTQGSQVPRFEEEVAALCGARHGIALNSATSALHIACLAMGIGAGDLVWTSSITFVASANAARYCGADVEFIDIDLANYNLDTGKLEAKLEAAKQNGRLPTAIIAVHMAGRSCDMAQINALSKRYGFRVIEDASHALGGLYGDKPVGSCQYADAAILSFHPVKMITTCEGGMILTNDDNLAEAARQLRTHGIVQNSSEHFRGEVDGRWHYQQNDLGFNYRLSDLHAALGRNQLEKLEQFTERRRQIAHHYHELFDHDDIICPAFSDTEISSWHLFIIRVKSVQTMDAKKALFDKLFEQGIGVALHYIPLYRHPYHQGPALTDFPGAEQYYLEAVSLPIFYELEDSQQQKVVDVLHRVLDQ